MNIQPELDGLLHVNIIVKLAIFKIVLREFSL